MYAINSEQIIGSYAVKYSRLIKLVNIEYANCNSSVINIFIDLTDIIKRLNIDHVEISTPYSIAASIINLCAHYRNFFREYYKTYARIFIVLSEINENSINTKSFPKYRRLLYGDNPKKNSMINDALKLVQLLIPYIEDIHYQYTNFEFGVVIKEIITWELTNENKEPIPGLIITKDPYNYQMVSNDECMMKILRPYKVNGEDESFMVTYTDAITMECYARKLVNADLSLQANSISYELLPLINALTRVPERGIPSLHQLPTAISAIYKLVSGKLIMNSYTNDIEYICNLLIKKKLLNVKDPSLIRARFNAIDLDTQFIAWQSMGMASYTGMVNLYDPEAVKEISMKYFKDNPLDLNVL